MTGSVPRKMACGREFQHPAGNDSEAISPDSLRLDLTQQSHDFVSIYRKKTEYDLTYLATLNRFFPCRIVILGLLKINIKARQDISEFLTANLWSIYVIATWIGVENFPLRTSFALCSSSSSLTSEKCLLRTWNLGQIFEIKLWTAGH